MPLNNDAIKSVVLVWKIDNFQNENLLMEKLFFRWPKTEHLFHLMLTSSDKTYEFSILKNDNSPFILCGTISTVTAEKYVKILCHFEDYKFLEQYDSYKEYLNLDEFQCLNDSLASNKTLTLRIHLWNPFRRDSITPNYFARTENKVEKCSFPWTIKRPIDNRRKEVVEVPRDFYFNDNLYNLLLTLNFVNTPYTAGKSSKFDVELIVSLKNPTRKQFLGFIPLKCKIDAISNEGIPLPFLESEWDFLHFRDNITQFPTKVKLFSVINTYHAENDLTLHCHITTKTNSTTVLEYVDYLPETRIPLVLEATYRDHDLTGNEMSSVGTLKDCMYKLYKEEKFCDVILSTHEKKFPCHKNVLCCRSAVFSAMFENDTKEKESGLVNIVDADAQTLDLFLTALCTDKIEDLNWENALAVYALADKYNISIIQKQCIDYLISNLFLSNVCDLLELADFHQDEILKKHAEKFFFRHAKEIIKSSHWSNFMSKNIELAADMMQKAFTMLD